MLHFRPVNDTVTLIMTFPLLFSVPPFVLFNILVYSLIISLKLNPQKYFSSNFDTAVSKMETIVPIFKLWTLALHSSSMSFKLLSFTILSNLISSLKEAIMNVPTEAINNDNDNDNNNNIDTDNNDNHDGNGSSSVVRAAAKQSLGSTSLPLGGDGDAVSVPLEFQQFNSNNINTHDTPHSYKNSLLSTLSTILAILPVGRLISTAAKRLWHEMEDFPSYSRYIQVDLIVYLFIYLLISSILFSFMFLVLFYLIALHCPLSKSKELLFIYLFLRIADCTVLI